MNRRQQLLKEIYDETRENIYLSECIVNPDKILERKDELINLKDYIPNLIRVYLGVKYQESISDNDEVQKLIYSKRKNTREEQVIDCINWVDAHKKFNDLLDEENINKIGNLLEDLEKDYNTFFKKLE